ncbi:MAG: tRNA (adenosine(37)-N6)-dimethylallyltransferase MiaA [Ignavibacteriaceae bacterium]|nr:tRNA (adenosine(37)-N6)-dimethylallyltransferase MiaA [Ignavibacteriaceae bacterium]
MNKYNLVTILGPTASGKTGLAAVVASGISGTILSADSRQVYKRLNIGTGKDYESYIVNGINIPFCLIDIISPLEEYNLFSFIKDFTVCYLSVISEKRFPIMVGGSGLYLSAIIQNYHPPVTDFNKERLSQLNELDDTALRAVLLNLNPSLHNTTDLLNRERMITAIMINEAGNSSLKPAVSFNSLNFLIDPGKETGDTLIKHRLELRLKSGMIEEVELLMKDIPREKLFYFGLEYRYLSEFLLGELTYNDMFQKLLSAIRNLAKRQRTWFRKMEKEGVELFRVNRNEPDRILSIIEEKRKAGSFAQNLPA